MAYLSYEIKKSIGLITINRPEALNALNSDLLLEMKNFLIRKPKEDALKVLIFTGSGDKAFIAGADIKEMHEMKGAAIEKFIRLGQEVSLLLENASAVTIAAVNGYALGGGLEMALACDFIYASKNAIFGLPEINLEIIPGFGGTLRLARAVGARMAKEMIATGKSIKADEALRLQLVNAVFDGGCLLEECFCTAEKIAQHSLMTLQCGKKVVNDGASLKITAGLEMEKEMFVRCFAKEERAQAMETFISHKKVSERSK